jgi:hypothetical protein
MKLDFDRLVQIGLRRGFEKVRRVPAAPARAPERKAVSRSPVRMVERKAAPRPRSQEEIDRSRGYISALGGQAKPNSHLPQT